MKMTLTPFKPSSKQLAGQSQAHVSSLGKEVGNESSKWAARSSV